MKLENLQNEFPKMPDEMRDMIQNEVERQLNMDIRKNNGKKKFAPGKMIAVILAATLAFGTTVFAAVSIYHLYMEKTGKYAVTTKIDVLEEGKAEGMDTLEDMAAMAETRTEIPPVKMEMDYLPEQITETAPGKYGKEGGSAAYSLLFYRMDQGDDAFSMDNYKVVSNESFCAGDYDGVYLEFQSEGEEDWMNQRIYVFYPDVHYVLEMYIDSSIPKEEAVKVAEGIHLIPVGSAEESNISEFMCDWSTAAAGKEETIVTDSTLEVPAKRMKNTHKIGEAFSLSWSDGDFEAYPGLTARVTDVQILDSVEILEEALLDQEWKEEITADKKLQPKEVQYVKYGDGVSTLDEIVESREVPQKLVYVTVEYGNEGTAPLTDVTYYGSLMRIKEDGNSFSIYNRTEGRTDCDVAAVSGLAGSSEMFYCDVRGTDGKNSFGLNPGDTVTVHMAYLVLENELPYLYLNLNSYGNAYEFDDTSLEIGYVDF